jgi:hypothetical protein
MAAGPPSINEVQVIAECTYLGSGADGGPYNVVVKFSGPSTGPLGLHFTFRNAAGQETSLQYPILISGSTHYSYFLLPAGTYVVTVKANLSDPQFVGYSSFTVKPYAVLVENGRKVCTSAVAPAPRGAPPRR